MNPAHASETALRDLLLASGLDAVVMTRGAGGAVSVPPDETVSHSGVPADVVDTVGAGDAFSAAFPLGFLRGEPAASNLKRACTVAAAACADAGAVPPKANRQVSE